MAECIFELKEASYSYLGRYPALCGLNIRISSGEKIAVVGANGSGKSTFLHLLDGLIFPGRGLVSAFGRRLSENEFLDKDFSRMFRSRVGLVFQNPDVQLFCPTVKEDIMFGPLQLGVERSQIKKRLEELAETLNIGELLERPPYRLSIGEKRKVAIASVLAIDPQVLLLDEPTAGLDPLTARHIMDIALSENRKGKTIITATHDLHILEEIADTLYVFGQKQKNIVRHGLVREVLSDHKLLAENNLLHIHYHRHKQEFHTHEHLHLDHHHE